MGARAKARKAADRSQAQYYEALSKIEGLTEVKRVDANTKRSINDAMGDDASYGTKRLAMKADKLAKSINKDDKYKENVGKYNQRYAQLKTQLTGGSVDRYYANDKPKIEVAQNQTGDRFLGIGNQRDNQLSTNFAVGSINPRADLDINTNDMSWKNFDQGQLDEIGKRNSERKYYNSAEEAQADAAEKMNSYNAGLDKLVGQNKPQDDSSGRMFGAFNNNNQTYSKQDIEAMKLKDASSFVAKENLGGIANNWRGSIGESGAAYGEMTALANKIKGSDSNANIEQYSDVAAKLRAKLAREQSGTDKPTGLLASELAGSELNTGVIRA